MRKYHVIKHRRLTQDFKRSVIEQLLSEIATPLELSRRLIYHQLGFIRGKGRTDHAGEQLVMPTEKEQMLYDNPQQPWPSDLPKPDQGSDHTECESALGGRYHPHMDFHLLRVFGGDSGCPLEKGDRVGLVKALTRTARPSCVTDRYLRQTARTKLDPPFRPWCPGRLW